MLSNKQFLEGEAGADAMAEEILIRPAEECDELHILSGYATSSMLKRHLGILDEILASSGKKVKIGIVVGMVPKDGLSIVEHKGFKDIASSRPEVACSYVMIGRKPAHSKLYIWLKDGSPAKAFVGSANYTQNAFFGDQIEVMHPCDPSAAEEYYQSFSGCTAFCDHDEIEDMVIIVRDAGRELKRKIDDAEDAERSNAESKNVVRLSLLTAKGTMGRRSSLNWGQREGRDRDQAYIPMPSKIAKSGFFPPKNTIMTVMTDDGIVLQCKTAGNKNETPIAKQIETPNDNSELGRYFRRRLGLPSGAYVSLEDLRRYGRTDVTFVDLEDGTYYMDFKPKGGDKIIDIID
jgi:HKD family nuclease